MPNLPIPILYRSSLNPFIKSIIEPPPYVPILSQLLLLLLSIHLNRIHSCRDLQANPRIQDISFPFRDLAQPLIALCDLGLRIRAWEVFLEPG